MKKLLVIGLLIVIAIPWVCLGKNVEETVDILQKSMSEDAEGRMYVGIKDVLVASDLERTCELGQAFYDHGIPFVVQIDPVMAYEELISFRQYTQVLRYLQSKGGTVCFSRSEASEADSEAAQKQEEDKSRQILTGEGVDVRELPEKIYHIDFETIERLNNNQRPFPKLGVDVIIEYNVPTDSDEILDIVKKIKGKWLQIRSLNEEGTIYTFNEDWIQDTEDEQATAAENEKFFNVGNRILVVIVSISLLVLVIGIGVGYLLYREKFYR